MKKSILILATLFIAAGIVSSCKKDKDEKPKYDTSNIFTTTYEEYGVIQEQHDFIVFFTSSCLDELEFSSNVDWISDYMKIDASNNSITTAIDENKGEYARSGEIKIRTKDKKYTRTIKILQEGTNGFCPDSKHPHALDLGIGDKWACCNVGATEPWGYGGYYAWGEKKEKEKYNEDTYELFKDGQYMDIGQDIAGSKYDVASSLWKHSWKMPTYEQFSKLTSCYRKWTSYKGKKGIMYTGLNGVDIFMPAAGFRSGNNTYATESNGYYWASTLYSSNNAYNLDFYSGNAKMYNNSRYCGFSVRPVRE